MKNLTLDKLWIIKLNFQQNIVVTCAIEYYLNEIELH